jgi:hypothetical protein
MLRAFVSAKIIEMIEGLLHPRAHFIQQQGRQPTFLAAKELQLFACHKG